MRLPTAGEDAISHADAATCGAPIYCTINCTHPTEFSPAFTEGGWIDRLGGFTPNTVAMEKLDMCNLGYLEDDDSK